jgi:energy-coupling factor transport system ATP-binding protein
MEEAARADKIIVMNEGRVLTEGTPSQVFSDPELLWGANLDVPQSTELLYKMRAAGLDVRLDIFDVEECADEIARAMDEAMKKEGVVNG